MVSSRYMVLRSIYIFCICSDARFGVLDGSVKYFRGGFVAPGLEMFLNETVSLQYK